MALPEQKALLALIKKDDPSAIRILFELYHASLCLIAFRLVRDRDSAKDIVQDVFIKFWNNRKTIEITSSLSGYLKRSVINASLNHIEKDRRHLKASLDEISKHPLEISSDQPHAYEELADQLTRAIHKLPVRTRAVFILIRNEEMSYKDVAESLDISTKAVEKEMMKALRLLRAMLKNFLPVFLMGFAFP